MGLPYSKQINAAFDSVTPLVSAGFSTLQTTKNISLFLAIIQVLTVLFLALIATILFGVLITVNPDLSTEREMVVTPVVKWVVGLMGRVGWGVGWGMLIVGVGMGLGVTLGVWYTARDPTLRVDGEGEDEMAIGEMKGEDVEAIRKGEAKQ